MIDEANLYLLTNQLIGENKECEIEDLFTKQTLEHIINGKTFSREKNCSIDNHYGKEIFSKYIYDNYATIEFSNFIPFLDNINEIILEYNNNT